jgi:hypothetical protein
MKIGRFSLVTPHAENATSRNNSNPGGSSRKPIHELFSEQAQLHLTKPQWKTRGSLSYRELLVPAVWRLPARGRRPRRRCRGDLRPSQCLFVWAILAVLKAGAVF